MHEMSFMSYLLETVETHARELDARHVLAVNVVMGDRSSMVDDSLLFYFDLMTPGTLAEGARLNIRRTPLTFHCAACHADYPPVGSDFTCPNCHCVGQLTNAGTELMVESIEIET